MRLKFTSTLFALSLGASALLSQPDSASAKPKAAAVSQGNLSKTTPLGPKGLHWGMTLEQVAKLYDKVIEDDYKPLFLKAGPKESLDLEEEQRNKQGVLRRSRIDFGDTPTGIDQSALKGEYSYLNGESLARFTPRSGTPRNFFFFKDKLWKVYDEHKLGRGSPLGENFEDAVKALAARFGGEPKRLPADFDQGRPFDEAVWRDNDKVIRAVDRGSVIGMAYADKTVQDNLAEHRKNKPVDEHAMDKDVAAATAHPPSGPGDAEKAAKERAAKEKATKPKGKR